MTWQRDSVTVVEMWYPWQEVGVADICWLQWMLACMRMHIAQGGTWVTHAHSNELVQLQCCAQLQAFSSRMHAWPGVIPSLLKIYLHWHAGSKPLQPVILLLLCLCCAAVPSGRIMAVLYIISKHWHTSLPNLCRTVQIIKSSSNKLVMCASSVLICSFFLICK